MRETPTKCEFCGRFGATKAKWIDPRGYQPKGGHTLELCPSCWEKQNQWALELQEEIDHDNYMEGWDTALILPSAFTIGKNQYWLQGFNDCLAGKKLPDWYDEWRKAQLKVR